ncbi:MAG: hypothetical protein C0490_25480, partial [Marivirga sp.]|nr:hypothetical protein [Marivirga sp.]
MNFGSRFLKLSYTLGLLVSLPFLLTIAFTGYFLWTEIEVVGNHPILFTTLAFLFTCHLLISLFFAKKLSNEINTVEQGSKQLGEGNFGMLMNPTSLPETSTIRLAIHAVKEDIGRQTQFAEEIMAGNLGAAYVPRHEQDVLGKALLKIRENLLVIKQEDQQRNWA